MSPSAPLAVSYWFDDLMFPRAFYETKTGFQRKLIFNFLSKIEEKKTEETHISLKPTYYYLVFEDGGFAFCSDAIGYSDSPGMLPAQYLFEDASPGDSTIQEYLKNLARVSYMQSQEIWTLGELTDPHKAALDRISPLFGQSGWPSLAGCIVDDLHVRGNKDGSFVFTGRATLKRYPLGEFASVLPIPRYSGDPMLLSRHSLVAACWKDKFATISDRFKIPELPRRVSKRIRTALEETTHILWNEDSRVIWIMGEPGSGKEVFAQALHSGGRQGNEKESNESISPQSIAGITLHEFSERLYGTDPSGTCVIERIDGVKGTIFLDEFDKPKEAREIYSALLRVLEAKQFLKREASSDRQRIIETPGTCKNVNWIMAGAFSQVNPRDSVPQDLWSRLTGFIQLQNPIQEDNYAGSLFLYRYLCLAANILSRETVKPLLRALQKEPSGRTYREIVACKLLDVTHKMNDTDALIPGPSLGQIVDDFQRLVRTKGTFSGDRLDTARGIIKATEAVFNYLRDSALEESDFELGAEKYRDAAIEEGHKGLRLSRGPI